LALTQLERERRARMHPRKELGPVAARAPVDERRRRVTGGESVGNKGRRGDGVVADARQIRRPQARGLAYCGLEEVEKRRVRHRLSVSDEQLVGGSRDGHGRDLVTLDGVVHVGEHGEKAIGGEEVRARGLANAGPPLTLADFGSSTTQPTQEGSPCSS